MNSLGLSHFIPELLSLGLLIYFLVEAIFDGNKKRPSIFSELSIGALLLGASLLFCSKKFGTGFDGFITADPLAFYFKLFFTAVFLVVTLMCRDFFKDTNAKQQECALILWVALIGLYFLASSSHVLILFISLETLTMSLYILTVSNHHLENSPAKNALAVEAGLKYLTLGSIASGFLIFGIALLYLQTGALSFSEIAAAKQTIFNSHLGILSLIFILTGLGFKIASFPFQFWIPDVYQGSPSPVTAFLSVASKAAGFLLLIRFFDFTVGPLTSHWKNALAILALFTLLYGNLGALAQTSVKRLMGYSSIGHAGYLLIAMASGTSFSIASILYYFLGYAASTLTVFYVLIFIERATGSDSADSLEGLSQNSPFLSSVFFIALLSLAGVPPLAGFMGKFWILFSSFRAGLSWLAAVGCGMVIVGIYYYLSLALKIFQMPRRKEIFLIPTSTKVLLLTLTLLSIGIGIFQAPLLRIASAAITSV